MLFGLGSKRLWRVVRSIMALTAMLTVAVAVPLAPPAGAINRLASQVSVGDNHACAVLSSGMIECWGNNEFGQLGDGTTTNSSVPVAVIGVIDALSVDAGQFHTCAVLSSGIAKCWGDNTDGQLGTGTTTGSWVPISVVGLTPNAERISAGGHHTCVELTTNEVYCWGANDFGQLGNGTTTGSLTPSLRSSTALRISVGLEFSCSILSSSSVTCWGRNDERQLQATDGVSLPFSTTSLGISTGNGPIADLNAGDKSACTISLIGGAIDCWGGLHQSSLPQTTSPPGATIVDPVQTGLGRQHFCARTAASTVHCWGENQVGQLGNGSSGNATFYPTGEVIGITDAVNLSSGGDTSCVVLATGDVMCWGDNEFGQLGDGSTADSTVPVLVAPLASPNGISPLPPCVLYDSSQATGVLTGPLKGGSSVDVQASGIIPAVQGGATNCGVNGATSGVLVNVTSKDPLRSGNIRVFPTGDSASGGVVNFSLQSPSLDNANAVIVPVSENGQLTIEINAGPTGVSLAATDVVITVIGFLDSSGMAYRPLTPCAFADSRSGTGVFAGRYEGSESRTVQAKGTFPADQGGGNTDCQVGVGAGAVLVNLVAVNPLGEGDIGVRASGIDETTYVGYSQFASSMNNSNAVMMPLSPTGTLDLYSVASTGNATHIRAVVLGYFDLSPTSHKYFPVTPCAAFDSRANQGATGTLSGPYLGGETRAVQITEAFSLAQGGGQTTCGVPPGATAVLVNVVAVNPQRAGNLRVSATGTLPTGGVVNFASLSPAMNNSNAVVVQLSTAGEIDITANGGAANLGLELADVRGVVLGYFI